MFQRPAFLGAKGPEYVFNADANAYNAKSAELQRKAGVNPKKCMRVGVILSNRQTRLPVFFPQLERRTWVTPQMGEFHGHDQKLHWGGVRRLHPAGVSLVMLAAAVGRELIGREETQKAEDMAWAIDYFVDINRKKRHYEELLKLSGKTDATDYQVLAAHAEVIQGLELQERVLNWKPDGVRSN